MERYGSGLPQNSGTGPLRSRGMEKMRQRVLRNKEQINEENKAYIVPDPKNQKGSWHSLFAGRLFGEDAAESAQSIGKMPLFLEIGSGKGLFITEMAKAHPDRLYLACEGAVNIYPRILQKAGALELSNLMLINEYIVHPADYFAAGELAGVYLNFSALQSNQKSIFLNMTQLFWHFQSGGTRLQKLCGLLLNRMI